MCFVFFFFKQKTAYEMRISDWSSDVCSSDLVGAKTLKYLYDFGDGWEHTIKIERLVDAVPGVIYPRLIEATGRCPPEDIGGPWGYGDFLEAIADPKQIGRA